MSERYILIYATPHYKKLKKSSDCGFAPILKKSSEICLFVYGKHAVYGHICCKKLRKVPAAIYFFDSFSFFEVPPNVISYSAAITDLRKKKEDIKIDF